MRARGVSHVRHQPAPELRRPRHTPPHGGKLPLAIRRHEHDGGHRVRVDGRERWKVAGRVARCPCEFADRLLPLGHAVEIAHAGILTDSRLTAFRDRSKAQKDEIAKILPIVRKFLCLRVRHDARLLSFRIDTELTDFVK